VRIIAWYCLLGATFLLPACQTPEKPFSLHLPASMVREREPPDLEQLLQNKPNVSWEKSSLHAPQSNYWAIPGKESFYLFRDGAQSVDANSALRYTRTPDGFELLTIEKKDALAQHPACPSYAPTISCIDGHTLVIATHIRCGAAACDYDFVIIDYFKRVRFLSEPPAIKAIIDYILDDQQLETYFPYRYAKEFNEKHRSSGNITSDNPLWLSYMSERFDLIQKKIDLAVAKFDILIVDNGKK